MPAGRLIIESCPGAVFLLLPGGAAELTPGQTLAFARELEGHARFALAAQAARSPAPRAPVPGIDAPVLDPASPRVG